ncbi:hypothetical protein MOMUL_25510 [Moorella mulderi DSM 14980]|uniref:Uncharacterized protein n=1 Tax=Moorella mulderi DSM 14980 TaxID=1122241 RepID=A0A151AUE6_9FIRM|nr:hypothetical protein MOMUL_25510 [Moorella mulderi DSM 14980]
MLSTSRRMPSLTYLLFPAKGPQDTSLRLMRFLGPEAMRQLHVERTVVLFLFLR